MRLSLLILLKKQKSICICLELVLGKTLITWVTLVQPLMLLSCAVSGCSQALSCFNTSNMQQTVMRREKGGPGIWSHSFSHCCHSCTPSTHHPQSHENNQAISTFPLLPDPQLRIYFKNKIKKLKRVTSPPASVLCAFVSEHNASSPTLPPTGFYFGLFYLEVSVSPAHSVQLPILCTLIMVLLCS